MFQKEDSEKAMMLISRETLEGIRITRTCRVAETCHLYYCHYSTIIHGNCAKIVQLPGG